LWATAEKAIIQRGSLMFLVWHILWFARVALSLTLFLVIIRHRLYKQFPLFTVYSGWITLTGVAVLLLNYAHFVSVNQYFAGVAIGNAVEAVLAFAIIYQIFLQRLHQYPAIKDLGSAAFRASTLVLLAAVLALAWLAPGPGVQYWTSLHSVIERSARTLQCGQLVFLVLFCAYFRLSWRSRVFGIVLGLGILSSSSLAMNAIMSQMGPARLRQNEYLLRLVNESANLTAVVVWLSYFLAREPSPLLPHTVLPKHDLETWNQELERMLEP
jgi:hypothetical protein